MYDLFIYKALCAPLVSAVTQKLMRVWYCKCCQDDAEKRAADAVARVAALESDTHRRLH